MILKSQYFKISSIFLVGFILVHFQIYLDFVLGNYDKMGVDFFIDKKVVQKSSIISSIALFSFYVGYIIKLNKETPLIKVSIKLYDVYSTKGLVFLAYLLFGLFLFNANWGYFQGKYGQEQIGGFADYFQEYLIYAVYGIILLQCRNMAILGKMPRSFLEYVNAIGYPLLLLLLIYFPLVILSGDRGPFLQIGIVYLGGYIYVTKKKVKIQYILIFLTLAISLVYVMGLARALTDKNSYLDKLKNVSQLQMSLSTYNSISPSTMELASVVRTMHAAVSYTEKSGFTYGLFQGFQIIGIVPGLGSVFKVSTGMEGAELRSAEFLTRQILGADMDHGLGTTCVADIYLDFGVFGITIVFLLFGYFLRYLEENSFSQKIPSLFVWIMIFVFLSQAVYIGRSTIITLFRDSLFTYLLILVGLFINRAFFNKEPLKVNQ